VVQEAEIGNALSFIQFGGEPHLRCSTCAQTFGPYSPGTYISGGFSDLSAAYTNGADPAPLLKGLKVELERFSPLVESYPFFTNACYWVLKIIDSATFFIDGELAANHISVTTIIGRSPVNIIVMDPLRRIIGGNPASSNSSANQIPDSNYGGPNVEPQEIVIFNPLNGSYQVRLVGTANGSFNISLALVTEDSLLNQSYSGTTVKDETHLLSQTIASGRLQSTAPITVNPSVLIPLGAGWNLISLYLVPDTVDVSKILAPLIAKNEIGAVWGYTGLPRSWKFLIPGKTGTLTSMVDGYGYWVYMLKADTLYLNGTVILHAATPPSYVLAAGWNLVGFKPQPTVQNETVTQYLTSISGSYDQNNVWIYDNTSGAWIRATSTTMFTPGEAMWILVTSPSGATLRT